MATSTRNISPTCIAEDIITQLSHSSALNVIARNSTFTYKGQGREFGVRYVLEGSVRRDGERVRVSTQLVEANTGNHIWAERFDRAVTDIFAVPERDCRRGGAGDCAADLARRATADLAETAREPGGRGRHLNAASGTSDKANAADNALACEFFRAEPSSSEGCIERRQ